MSPCLRRCRDFIEEIAGALQAEYGLDLDVSELPIVLGFGSWIGGDRDGNPFVTSDVTREAIAEARGRLLRYYEGRLHVLISLLTTSAQQLPVSEEMKARLDSYLGQLQTGPEQIFGTQFQFEMYRRFLMCIHARLLRTAGVESAIRTSRKPSAESAGRRCPRIARRRSSRAIWRFCGGAWRRTRDCAWRGSWWIRCCCWCGRLGCICTRWMCGSMCKQHNKALEEASAWCAGNAAKVPAELSAESQSVIDGFRTIAEVKAAAARRRFGST